jgi:MFS family permease
MTERGLSSQGGEKSGFFHSYAMVIGTFLAMMAGGMVIVSFGVFFKPVSAQFGWTRAETSGAFSLSIIMSGLIGVVAGRLGDRFSPRLVIISGGVIQGLAYLLLSQMHALWQLYFYYGILVGAGIANIVPVTSLIARWYEKRRGLMTGIAIVGASIGAVIAPPMATQFVSRYGWSTSYIMVGGIVLVIIAISGIFLRDPDKVRRPAYGDTAEIEKLNSEIRGFSLGEVLGTGSFWILGVILFCVSFAQQALTVHIVPHATDLGISAVSAASILSVINVASIVGAFGTGNFSDRIGSRLSMVIALAIISTAALLLLEANELRTFYLFAILFGIGFGGTATLRSTMIAESFGLRSHGVITGALYFVSSIGGTISPLVAGYIFDVSGQYQSAFLVIVGLSVVGLVLALLLRLRTERLR